MVWRLNMPADLRASLLAKYGGGGGKPAPSEVSTPSIKVVSSPGAPSPAKTAAAPTARAALVAKYSGKTTQGTGGLPVFSQPANQPQIADVRNTPNQGQIVDSRNAPAGPNSFNTTLGVDPTVSAPPGEVKKSFVDNIKNFFGIDTTPKSGPMVFPTTDPDVLAKANIKESARVAKDLATAGVKNPNVVTGELNASEAARQESFGYRLDRIGNIYLSHAMNMVLPKSLMRAAAGPGSIADQYVSGLLDPQSTAEQVAAYSGNTLGSIALFAGASTAVAKVLSKVPAWVAVAEQFPKIANVIQGGVAFSVGGAAGDINQEKPAKELVRDIPGNFLTGSGFGVADSVGLIPGLATVGGTSFAGSKLSGQTNTAAATSAVLNMVFKGLDTSFKGKTEVQIRNETIANARKNALETLGLKEGATAEQIKVAYRSAAHDTHPDLAGGDTAKFIEVNAANKILRDNPNVPGQESLIDEAARLYNDIKSGKNIFSQKSEMPTGPLALPAGQEQTGQITENAPKTSETSQNTQVVEKTTPQNAPGAAQKEAVTSSLPAQVSELLAKDLTPKVVNSIRSLPDAVAPAFNRELRSIVTKATGIAEGNAKATEKGIVFNDFVSPDGRPAQFNLQGKIEVFLPSLKADINYLMDGGEMRLHEGPDVNVFAKLPGENFQQLAGRYTREVIMHEMGHRSTQSLESSIKLGELSARYGKAQKSGDAKEISSARRALTEHMGTLERQANSYVRQNRAALEKEYGAPVATTAKETRNAKVAEEFTKAVQLAEKPVGEVDKKSTLKTIGERVKSAISRENKRVEIKTAKDTAVSKAKEVIVTRYETTLKKIKDRGSTAATIRNDLVGYAKDLLPLSSRGKFLAAVKNAATHKDFEEVLNRMHKESDLVNRKNLINQITKELKQTKVKFKDKKPTNVKYEVAAQRRLDEIRKNIGASREIAQDKIYKMIEEFKLANPDSPVPDDMVSRIEMLDMVGIKEMNASQLTKTLDNIVSIKESGKTAKEIQLTNEAARIEDLRNRFFDIISGGQQLNSEKFVVPPKPRKTAISEISRFLSTQQYAWQDVLDMLSKFDKTSKPYESELSKFGERSHDAFRAQNAGELAKGELVTEAIRDIYNLKENKDAFKLIHELQVEHDLGNVRMADGTIKNLTISRDEAIKKVMELEDPTLASRFEEGMNWGPEVIDKMKSILTEQDYQLAEWQLAFYREEYIQINKVFEKDYGYTMPFNEMYSPVRADVEGVTVPENVLLAKESRSYASAANGSLKARVQNSIPLKIEPSLHVLWSHINKMEHYKAWADTMKDFRKVFSDPQLRAAIRDFHGNDTLVVVDNFLNDMARDGVDRAKIIPIVDKLRANVTRAILGFNPNVGIKQFVGVTDYLMVLPITDFFGGVANFWLHPIENAKFLYDNSPIFQERFGEGYERDIKFAVQSGEARSFSKYKDVKEKMFSLIRLADKTTVYMGGWASFKSKQLQLLRAGRTDMVKINQEAVRYAEMVTHTVQETSQLDTLAPLQRGGSMMKLFTMFQSQSNKYYRITVSAMRNWRAGRGDKKELARQIIMAWFVIPMLYQFFADKFKFNKAHQAQAAIFGPFNYVLIFGQLMQSAVGWIQGEKYTYQPSPAFGAVTDLQNGLSDIMKGDNLKFWRGITRLIDLMGKVKGIPTTVVTKPARSAIKNAMQ